ncbi:hypothetical protein WT60_22870 [Burkholderia sp. MSMB617WGS]|uniref:Uncharacterized protein n=1 Tax=Burkholderia savannae TaxID=1637837 RepID=A0ABR5T460_9BURK|nr:hypothetical protein [Burkholderia savannae]AOK49734.1 hypothetical protein WT60_22870 [Burkholderia sp. MSMB617WGS]KVG49153.1 hypothetical protein WS77_26160 [Burkholderia sp. MSMB0265]KVG81927.1 hypothetical protein WS81_11185 [Burkholderia sp. MSMB2040]KVG92442.1 hypothetical protein WS82_11650 [Burkholderia sp. MSMB2041]AOJ71339.1 hypothetical protein WS78_21070 [Burkholderia savannae]
MFVERCGAVAFVTERERREVVKRSANRAWPTRDAEGERSNGALAQGERSQSTSFVLASSDTRAWQHGKSGDESAIPAYASRDEVTFVPASF